MYFQQIANSNILFFLPLIILLFSVLFDIILGELPTKIHPVVFIGKTIDFFSKYLITFKNIWSGFILAIIVLLVVVLAFLLLLLISTYNIFVFLLLSSLILSSTFSIKMLLNSAKSVYNDLNINISYARKSMSYLVSRDTSKLDEALIISATIETLSENITDSVISPIFYYFISYLVINLIFILFISYYSPYVHQFVPHFIPQFIHQSIPHFTFNFSFLFYIIIIPIIIAIFYRVINTLDAMVGYNNEKYANIGYFSAKLDDILNYIPARLGGALIILASFLTSFLFKNKDVFHDFDYKNSYFTMKNDARNCPSPNSGFTMAAMAGALNVSLIKRDTYKIGNENKNNRDLSKNDIIRAIFLSKLSITLYIFFLMIFLIFLIFIFINFY